MPTGHLRTNKRRPKDAERMRLAMEMQRPLDHSEFQNQIDPNSPIIKAIARTTHDEDVKGYPI